ncbi:MAG: hypothetical protein ACOC2L_05290 [Candidatus Sumerlaeota bacterium]
MSADSSRNISRSVALINLVAILIVLLLSTACSSADLRPLYTQNGDFRYERRISKNPDRGLLFLRSRQAYQMVEHPYAEAVETAGKFDPSSAEANEEGFIQTDPLPQNLMTDDAARYAVNHRRYPEDRFSPDQVAVLKRFGSPECVRRFTSLRNEEVDEWLFVRRRKVVQFCQGYTVFLGNMKDEQEILYTHGRPDYAIVAEYKDGPGHLTFVYRSHWGRDMRTFSFTRDGDLVDSVR